MEEEGVLAVTFYGTLLNIGGWGKGFSSHRTVLPKQFYTWRTAV